LDSVNDFERISIKPGQADVRSMIVRDPAEQVRRSGESTMFNPYLAEVVAREQNNDRLKDAEQRRFVKRAIVRQPANRINLRTYLANRLTAMRHMFKALASADETNGGSGMSAGRHRP
jgi:hypothetical protein